MRSSVPADQPLNLETCLRLYERLYGPCNAAVLVERIQAMDREFMTQQHEQRERERKRDG